MRRGHLLAADDAHHVRTAHHGELLLRRLDGALQSIGQGLGRGEGDEVGDHHVDDADALQHRLQNHAAVFQLSGQEEKDPGHHDPEIVGVGTQEDHSAAEEQRQGKELSDGNRAPGGRDLISAARQQGAQNASAIERIGGQQVERGDKKLRPGEAARKIERSEPGEG